MRLVKTCELPACRATALEQTAKVREREVQRCWEMARVHLKVMVLPSAVTNRRTADSNTTGVSVLLTVGPKCTMAASRAAPW